MSVSGVSSIMLPLLLVALVAGAVADKARLTNWIHDTGKGAEFVEPCVVCEVKPQNKYVQVATYMNPNGVKTKKHLPTSCRAALRADRGAPSGVYNLRTNRGRVVQAYCEMGISGGGWTFIAPSSLGRLSQKEVDGMRKDRKCVLMRLKKSDGTQPFSVLCQLPAYRKYPVGVRVSNNGVYKGPVNQKTLGAPYLLFGWIPKKRATNKHQQGLTSNAAQVKFRNCDRNPNSYIALFVNPNERKPSTYGRGWGGGVSAKIAATASLPRSGRQMPGDMFYFTELHWGGCGVYGQTDRRSKTILGSTIGFR